jgi:hypothetical protein
MEDMKLLTAKAWAEITIKDFQKAIRRYRIGQYGKGSGKKSTQKLVNSFNYSIHGADSDRMNILIQFLYWGSFTEWGVGKGVSIEDVSILSKARGLTGRIDGQRRKPKRWYSKTIYYEVKALTRILSEKYNIQANYAIDLHKAGFMDITLF